MNLNLKRISLIVVVVASSAGAWAVARMWLDDPLRFTSILTMLWPALAFVGSGAITAVAFMLQEHKADRLAGIFASWAIFIAFWSPDVWYISALPVFSGLWWLASRDIRHDLKDRHTIRASSTLQRGMKLILLGLFLMVSLGFYLMPSQQSTVNGISRSVQSSIANNPFLQQQIPVGSRGQFNAYIDQTVRTWLGPVKQFIPPILAFGLFLSLWSLNSLLRYPAVWLGNGLFLLLKRTGFVKIEKGQIETETLKI